MQKLGRVLHNQKGFTLPELLVSMILLAPLYMGVSLSFIQCMSLNDASQEFSQAIGSVQNQVSVMHNTPFDQVFSTYNNTTFTVAGMTGIGAIDVDNSAADLLTVTVSYCWQTKDGRLMGEDVNLNGQLDAGEDVDNDGLISSPATLITMMYDS